MGCSFAIRVKLAVQIVERDWRLDDVAEEDVPSGEKASIRHASISSSDPLPSYTATYYMSGDGYTTAVFQGHAFADERPPFPSSDRGRLVAASRRDEKIASSTIFSFASWTEIGHDPTFQKLDPSE